MAGHESTEARGHEGAGRDIEEDERRYGISRQNLGDWLVIIDESHVTIPQINAMFNGDKQRKDVLVEHGFRLPSALDNRPLRFEEFESMTPRIVYVSATPGKYELEKCAGVIAEQVIRPTGLLDPVVEIRPAQGQVTDLVEACRERVADGDRVLVTALTKRLCEDLTNYLAKQDLRVRYLHSEIDTLERVEIITDLRAGEFDILVGVNLLREGLDMPEVSLVCILDADKEGYLRSATSLIQQMGRAARNDRARVILYADRMTPSMTAAIEETERRREKQLAYNEANGITPQTIRKSIRRGIEAELKSRRKARDAVESDEPMVEADQLVSILEGEMLEAAESMEFEKAATLRDQMKKVQEVIEAERGTREPDDDAPVLLRRSEIERALGGKGRGSGRKKRRSKTGRPGGSASAHRSKSRRPGR